MAAVVHFLRTDGKDGFRFTIYRSGFFTALGEALGMTDIKIGDAAFDESFVVKANSEERVAHSC